MKAIKTMDSSHATVRKPLYVFKHRLAQGLSRLERRLNPVQRVMLFVFLIAAWTSVIMVQTYQGLVVSTTSLAPPKGEPEIPYPFTDSTLFNQNINYHENDTQR